MASSNPRSKDNKKKVTQTKKTTGSTDISKLHAQTAPPFGGPTYTTTKSGSGSSKSGSSKSGSTKSSSSKTNSGSSKPSSKGGTSRNAGTTKPKNSSGNTVANKGSTAKTQTGRSQGLSSTTKPKTNSNSNSTKSKTPKTTSQIPPPGGRGDGKGSNGSVKNAYTKPPVTYTKDKDGKVSVTVNSTRKKDPGDYADSEMEAKNNNKSNNKPKTGSDTPKSDGSKTSNNTTKTSNTTKSTKSNSSNTSPNYKQLDPTKIPTLTGGYTPYDVSALLQTYFGSPAKFAEPELENLAMGDRYDLMYDYDNILEILDNATKKKYNELWNEYSQTENAYYNQNLADQSATLDNIRRAQAQATMSGASAGMQAANMLTSIMSGQQNNAANQLELANQRNNTALQEQTELAANKNTALETSNAVKQAIAGLDDTVYGYRTQDHIGHMDYDAALKTAIGQVISGMPSANAQVAASKIGAGADMYNGRLNYNGTVANAGMNLEGTKYAANHR